MPQIEVAFDIDANGIINVSAKDLGTSNEQQIRIEGGSGLKEDEVQQMIKNAEAHAEEAHRLRELADTKNEAEGLAYQTEKSLKEHRDKLDSAVASTVEGRIMELRQSLDSSDLEQIRAKRDALQDGGRLGPLRPGVGLGTDRRQRLRDRPGRRGDRGCRLRGRRRGGGGQDLLSDSHPPDRMSQHRVDPAEVVERDRGSQPAPPVGPAAAKSKGAQEREALAEALRERDEYLDALQRLKAEFDNYRKRVAREQEQLAVRASERLVKQLLPMLDDLERAVEAAVEHGETKVADGVRLVQRSLGDLLVREGLTEVEAEGAFDPHTQEALLTQPSDAPDGHVIQVLQKGYRLGDHVLRPARVVVSSGPPAVEAAE